MDQSLPNMDVVGTAGNLTDTFFAGAELIEDRQNLHWIPSTFIFSIIARTQLHIHNKQSLCCFIVLLHSFCCNTHQFNNFAAICLPSSNIVGLYCFYIECSAAILCCFVLG
jgi:hypothetical protein